MDSSRFFYFDGERSPGRERREAYAKAICQQCQVVDACRTRALEVREPHGIWGGLTEVERAQILGVALH